MASMILSTAFSSSFEPGLVASRCLKSSFRDAGAGADATPVIRWLCFFFAKAIRFIIADGACLGKVFGKAEIRAVRFAQDDNISGTLGAGFFCAVAAARRAGASG